MNLKLKIFKLNSHLEKLSPIEIMATDFTILNGIVCGEPIYVKGVKTSAGYFLDNDQKDLAIEKTFEDVLSKDGFLTGIKMQIKWFDEMGNPALQKEVFIPLSVSESSEIIRGRRKRQINYLQDMGVKLGAKQYIDMLFNYYSSILKGGVTVNLLNNYIENNSQDFKQAVLNETNPNISAILSAKLPDGNIIKDSIINQIS